MLLTACGEHCVHNCRPLQPNAPCARTPGYIAETPIWHVNLICACTLEVSSLVPTLVCGLAMCKPMHSSSPKNPSKPCAGNVLKQCASCYQCPHLPLMMLCAVANPKDATPAMAFELHVRTWSTLHFPLALVACKLGMRRYHVFQSTQTRHVT
jgi:hypothetical protein